MFQTLCSLSVANLYPCFLKVKTQNLHFLGFCPTTSGFNHFGSFLFLTCSWGGLHLLQVSKQLYKTRVFPLNESFLSCPNDDLWLVSCQKDLLFDAWQVKFFHLQGEFSCFTVILCRVGKLTIRIMLTVMLIKTKKC